MQFVSSAGNWPQPPGVASWPTLARDCPDGSVGSLDSTQFPEGRLGWCFSPFFTPSSRPSFSPLSPQGFPLAVLLPPPENAGPHPICLPNI